MKHEKSYIICATPRSGSTLLCDLLTETAVAGSPNSFFRRQSYAEWAEYFGVSTAAWHNEQEFDSTYLAATLKQGTDGTQVFGLRLMWESLGDLSARLDTFYPGHRTDHARFAAAFGPPVYIHLSREDKIAQAVSHLRAEQSGLWHINPDGTERERLTSGHAPVYDARSLSDLVKDSERHDTAWINWFAGHGIEPVSVTYETLAHAPQAVLAMILSALGLDPARAAAAEPRTAKLADKESRDWATRFRMERPNLSS